MKTFDQEICERCEHSFTCMPENISACHCSQVTIDREERQFIALRYTTCLCGTCLQELKKEYANRPLYYFENGFIVFTEKYHLQRGQCCKSGCRHCPYRFKKSITQNS